MGLGSTAKRLKKLVSLAEEQYQRMNELSDRLVATEETVEETNSRVAALETELAAQRALLEAVATEHGVDVEAIATASDTESASSVREAAEGTDGSESDDSADASAAGSD